MQNTWPYRVDGELGRVEFPTYQVWRDETIVYDTVRELFTPLGCWERSQTIGLKELAFIYGMTERSSRNTEPFINRIRHQEGATGSTTLRTSAEREGQQVMACLEQTATEVLLREGFDETGQPLNATPFGQEGLLSPQSRSRRRWRSVRSRLTNARTWSRIRVPMSSAQHDGEYFTR